MMDAPLEIQEIQSVQPDELSPAALTLSTPPAASGMDNSESRELPRPLGEERVLPPGVRDLPVQLDIRVPLASFRVRDLLSLTGGMVLETKWPASEDLPLGSGAVRLVWAEFEVVDQMLAARITRLA